MAECRSCGAVIVWAETPDGHRQPFDREPTSDGNRLLLGRGADRAPLAVPTAAAGDYEGPAPLEDCFYMPHHATCPQSADWAGRTRANPPPEAA